MPYSLCLIGHPLGHSLSPFIHKRLLALSGIEGDYTLCDMQPETFEATCPNVLAQIHGCNVTIPFKQRIVPLLDRVEGKAALYNTVNTVAVTPQGTVGYNTDADGFLRALEHADIPLKGRVCVLGAGGAGTVLASEAVLAGCDVVIHNPRTPSTAARLCDHLKEIAPDAACEAAMSLPTGDFDLLINTTPVGMYPNTDAVPVPDSFIRHCGAVFDAVYNPRETVLLQTAAANGAKTAGGMAMLVWQAAIAHSYWFATQPDPARIACLIEDCYSELITRF